MLLEGDNILIKFDMAYGLDALGTLYHGAIVLNSLASSLSKSTEKFNSSSIFRIIR